MLTFIVQNYSPVELAFILIALIGAVVVVAIFWKKTRTPIERERRQHYRASK